MNDDQRKDCRYIPQKCPNYSPDAYTCNHGGGDYCGLWRQKEEKQYKKSIMFWKSMLVIIYTMYCAVGIAIIYFIQISTYTLETMSFVILFAWWFYNAIKMIGDVFY